MSTPRKCPPTRHYLQTTPDNRRSARFSSVGSLGLWPYITVNMSRRIRCPGPGDFLAPYVMSPLVEAGLWPGAISRDVEAALDWLEDSTCVSVAPARYMPMTLM